MRFIRTATCGGVEIDAFQNIITINEINLLYLSDKIVCMYTRAIDDDDDDR